MQKKKHSLFYKLEKYCNFTYMYCNQNKGFILFYIFVWSFSIVKTKC